MHRNPAQEQIYICLPTYNESTNLPLIVDEISSTLPSAHICIIDDNSPDGTGKVADQLARKDTRIHVLHRRLKQGLGRAYMDGFHHLLTRSKCRFIVQMDADFSHPPKYLPDMLRMAESADLVIGSRYIPGGGTINWNAMRRLISRFGSIYSRIWLGLPIGDLTGGFKVWNRDLLQSVIQYPISAGGYAFQIEATYIASQLGARIKEIPIYFIDRNLGQSKMSLSIAFEAFWRVPLMRLRRKKPTQLIRFKSEQ